MDVATLTSRIDSLTADGATPEALELASLYFERGKLLWRAGQRALAQADYARATALDPDSPAALALQHARAIDDFSAPDRYNP